MNFCNALKVCLWQKYATFSGRAKRSEFWYFALLLVICDGVMESWTNIGWRSITDGYRLDSLDYVVGVYILGTIIPRFSALVRRLHDVNKSGWFMLIVVLPYIGVLILLYFLVKKGTAGPNRFGDA